MSQVAKTKENLKKCICMKCPSYSMGCKIKSMPENIMGMMGGIANKKHLEGMFCAFEQSNCIREGKGCVCPSCDLYKENNLGKTYFCLSAGGK